MKHRACPVCGERKCRQIMKFSPELLLAVNTTYKEKDLKASLNGKEDFLTYSQCETCGMVYCEHVFDDDTLRKVYQQAIDHQKSKQKTLKIKKRIGLIRIWIHMLRLLKLSGRSHLGDLKVLDYGCGWGDFLDVVDGYGVQVLGFDGDNIKTELPIERGHNIVASTKDIEKNGPYDIVVMNSVLEHLQDVEETMRLVDRVLKPRGLLVLHVMDYRSAFLKKNMRRLEQNKPALTKNLNPVEHVNVYSYQSLMNTFKHYHYQFVATSAVMYLTDTFLIRNSLSIIRLFNIIENISTRLITGRRMGITAYAYKK